MGICVLHTYLRPFPTSHKGRGVVLVAGAPTHPCRSFLYHPRICCGRLLNVPGPGLPAFWLINPVPSRLSLSSLMSPHHLLLSRTFSCLYNQAPTCSGPLHLHPQFPVLRSVPVASTHSVCLTPGISLPGSLGPLPQPHVAASSFGLYLTLPLLPSSGRC